MAARGFERDEQRRRGERDQERGEKAPGTVSGRAPRTMSAASPATDRTGVEARGRLAFELPREGHAGGSSSAKRLCPPPVGTMAAQRSAWSTSIARGELKAPRPCAKSRVKKKGREQGARRRATAKRRGSPAESAIARREKRAKSAEAAARCAAKPADLKSALCRVSRSLWERGAGEGVPLHISATDPDSAVGKRRPVDGAQLHRVALGIQPPEDLTRPAARPLLLLRRAQRDAAVADVDDGHGPGIGVPAAAGARWSLPEQKRG